MFFKNFDVMQVMDVQIQECTSESVQVTKLTNDAAQRRKEDFETLHQTIDDYVTKHRCIPYCVVRHLLVIRYLGAGLLDSEFIDKGVSHVCSGT